MLMSKFSARRGENSLCAGRIAQRGCSHKFETHLGRCIGQVC